MMRYIVYYRILNGRVDDDTRCIGTDAFYKFDQRYSTARILFEDVGSKHAPPSADYYRIETGVLTFHQCDLRPLTTFIDVLKLKK